MKKILLFAAVLFFTSALFSQGCTVNASVPRDTIVCGESILLTAYSQGPGIPVLTESFGTGGFGPGWSSTPQVMWNNPCGPNTVDGTTYIWMGNSSPVPRILSTAAFNLSSCTNAGVTICFDMKFATQGDVAPCEGPDEPGEGVYVQYSTNGSTWTDIHYFDPNGGTDPQLVNWNNWCFPVPAAALTSTTQFRWFQDVDSGADYDHWGIDNVIIYCNDSTFGTVWQHDGYNVGPNGGTNPNPISPHTTTSYVVTMSNGTISCSDTVTVVVVNPTLVVDAGLDTSVCSGQCIALNAAAQVIQKPAKTPTYTNQEVATISGTPGFPGFPPFIPAMVGYAYLNMDINITNLNLSTVQNGYITSVCIGSLDMVLFSGVEIFDIWLVCPSGDSILLVPDTTLVGTTLTNTCFVPAGSNITSSSAPYTGNFAPNQSFNNLTGCDANGVWSLHFDAVYPGITLPTGTFNSWSISFDDPEISYPGVFSWSPTTGMTNSTTLTPSVCPPPNAYVLTVSDTAGCVTLRDTVNVTSQSCCGLSAQITQMQPTCATSNGSINVMPVPAGTYTYAWSDGPSTAQNRNGLAAGTYMVTITDVNIPTCVFDTSITLNSNSTLNVAFTNPLDPTCAGNDGAITVTIGGGTAPYTVSVDTNGTPVFTGVLPIAITQTFNGLPAGSVALSVSDAQGCLASTNATLTAPANCCTFTVSDSLAQPACAQTNGSIVLSAANGSGNYAYNWAGGLGTGNSIINVGAGNYPVTITDNAYANCFIDTTFTLTNPNAPLIDNIAVINETCIGTNDGAVTITASGGSGTLTIAWSNGSSGFAITGLAGGTINFTVTDASSCAVAGTATVNTGNGCCNLLTSSTVIPPTCGLNNATITINISTSGNPPYTYSIDGTNFQLQNIFSNVSPGNYSVITLDANSCSDTVLAVVPVSGNNLLVNLTASNVTCFGWSDGMVNSGITGGNAPYNYAWSNTESTSSITNLSGGNYSLTVSDVDGCSGSASAPVTEPQALTLNLGNDLTVCEGQVIMLTAGSGFASYQWSTNEITASIIPVASGDYTVTVTNQNGCTASDLIKVTLVPAPTIELEDDKIAYEGDHVGLFANINSGHAVGGTYSWQPDTLLSCAFCQNTVAVAADTITYTLVYYDQYGCTSSDSITLYVLPTVPIFWPSAFSPTGDGNNDIYLPYGNAVKQINWQIFNRWGEKVFESTNFFQGWDGYYKGRQAPSGVYVYLAKVVMMNNDKKEFKGSLTLIR